LELGVFLVAEALIVLEGDIQFVSDGF